MMKYLILFFLLLFNFCFAQIFPLSNSQDVDQDGIIDISIVFYPPQPPPTTGYIGYKIFAKSGLVFHNTELSYGSWVNSNLSFNNTLFEIPLSFSTPSEHYYAFYDSTFQKYGWIYFHIIEGAIHTKYYGILSDSIQVGGMELDINLEATSESSAELTITSYQQIAYSRGYLVPYNQSVNLDSLKQSSHYNQYYATFYWLCNLNGIPNDYQGNPIIATKPYSFYVLSFPSDTTLSPILNYSNIFYNYPCFGSNQVNFANTYLGAKNYEITATFTGHSLTDSAYIELPNQIIPVELSVSNKQITFTFEKNQTFNNIPIRFVNVNCNSVVKNYTINLVKSPKVMRASNHRISIFTNDQLEAIFNNFDKSGLSKVFYGWIDSSLNLPSPWQLQNFDSLILTNGINKGYAQKQLNGNSFEHGKKYKLLFYAAPDFINADTSYSSNVNSVPYFTTYQDTFTYPYLAGIINSQSDYYSLNAIPGGYDYDADSLLDVQFYSRMISHIPIVVQYYFKSDNGLELHTKYINTNYPDTLGSVFYPTDSFSIDWQTGSMGKFHPIRKIIDGKLTYGWISNDLVCFFTKINMVSVDEFLESDILYLQSLKKVVFPSIFEEIRVINLIGQTQIQQKIIGLNEFSLTLESGIYVLELTKNKKMVRKKIYIE